MRISIGILVIGSLCWGTADTRVSWRCNRLDLSRSVKARVPIRYGRKSQKRGSTYTMVFSGLLAADPKHYGDAIAAPCTRDIRQPGDLITEAEWLWAAEDENHQPNGQISAAWGSVGLLRNPNGSVPQALIREWTERVRSASIYGNLATAQGEETILNQEGLFQIPWPHTGTGDPVDLDLLLATATNPTLYRSKYPGPNEIAQAWNNDDGGHVEYFWKNRAHGISTFEDDKIMERLA